jgi:hypothetical protein
MYQRVLLCANLLWFDLVLSALQGGVAIYDQDGTLIWVNSTACQILDTLRAVVAEEQTGCCLLLGRQDGRDQARAG